MNTKQRLAVRWGLIWLGLAAAAPAQVNYSMSAGGRYHTESKALPDLPYGDGDWSTVLGVEVKEGAGYWQLAVDMAYGAELNKDADLILTPQLNLMAQDKGFIGGLGIMGTYVQDSVAGDEWTDVYYQFSFGLEFPLGNAMTLTLLTHYPFEDWGRLDDFDFEDVEYSSGLRYRF